LFAQEQGGPDGAAGHRVGRSTYLRGRRHPLTEPDLPQDVPGPRVRGRSVGTVRYWRTKSSPVERTAIHTCRLWRRRFWGGWPVP